MNEKDSRGDKDGFGKSTRENEKVYKQKMEGTKRV